MSALEVAIQIGRVGGMVKSGLALKKAYEAQRKVKLGGKTPFVTHKDIRPSTKTHFITTNKPRQLKPTELKK